MDTYSNLRQIGLNCAQWRNSSPAQKAQLVATRLLGIGGKWAASPQAGQVRGIVQKLDEYCTLVTNANPTAYDGVVFPAGQASLRDGPPNMVRVSFTTNPINVVLPQEIRPAVPNWQTAQAYGYTCDGWQNLSREEQVAEILRRHPEAPSWGGPLALAEEVRRQVGSNCRPRPAIQILPTVQEALMFQPRRVALANIRAAGQAAPTDAERVSAAVAPVVAREVAAGKRKRVWQFITVGAAAVVVLAISVK